MNTQLLLLTLFYGLSEAAFAVTPVYEWGEFDYKWPSAEARQRALQNGDYKPENLIPDDLVIFENRIFLRFSTSFGGVPWTLAWLPTDGKKKKFPKLNPFPSKKLSEKLKCNKIQLVKAMRVDSVGRLWAVDFGSTICPAKLWIFDLKNNDSTVLVYNFPKETLSHDYHQQSLIDMVVDERMTDTFSYISDHYYGTMIVFSLRTRISRNTRVAMQENFDSIAISSGTRTKYLYFSSREKSGVFALPVSDLRDGKAGSVASFHVGNKASGSFKILMDSKDILYFDVLNKTLIRTWNTSMTFKEELFYLGDPDDSEPKFCLDHNDHLWVLTRNTVNRRSFRLVRIKVISMKVTETSQIDPEVSTPSPLISDVEDEAVCNEGIGLKIFSALIVLILLFIILFLCFRVRILQVTFIKIESYLRETPAYYSGVAIKNRSLSVKSHEPPIPSISLKVDSGH